MTWKIVPHIIAVFFLAVLQLSFLNGLPPYYNAVNLVLAVSIFVLGLKGLRWSLFYAAGIGLLLDMYSFLPFGSYILSLSFAMLLANFLLVNFFTNRSIFSYLALAFSGLLAYEACLQGLAFIYGYFSESFIMPALNGFFWQAKAAELALTLAAVVIIFYSLNYISRNWRPVFLTQKHLR